MATIGTNNQVLFPANNASLMPPRLQPTFSAAPSMNTLDSASFSVRPGTADLDAIAAKVAELDSRIHILEGQVGGNAGQPGTAAMNTVSSPVPYPQANLQQPPAFNQATNGAPTYLPAAPTSMPPVPPPPPAPAPPPLPGYGADQQNAQMRAQLTQLSQRVEQSIRQVNQVLAQVQQPQPAVANVAALPASNNQGGDVAGDPTMAAAAASPQAGQMAVQNVLRYVKPGTYSTQDQATVDGAVKRVQQIGQAIAGGADPGQFAAELFTLKHLIQDPGGVGNHPEVTRAAQVIQAAEEAKSDLLDQLKAFPQGAQLTAQQKQDRDGLVQSYKTVTEVEQALDGAKLTRLTDTGHKTATAAIDRLGADVEAVAGGSTDGKELEGQIYRLGQVLRSPNTPARPNAVDAGAGVVGQISNDQAKLKQRLGEIDDAIAGGAAPEAYTAQRADLMDRLGALNELSGMVRGARADQGNPNAARQVQQGLQKAAALSRAIASGDGPEPHRADMFVLKQTFQEPLGSLQNPAVQAGAAAIQQIGLASKHNLQQQAGIQSAIARGADPRGYDQASSQLHRQQADLDAMRNAIEGVDFGGLTPDQQAHGAELLDRMSRMAQQVAKGGDGARAQAGFQRLAQQLNDLHTYQGGSIQPTSNPQPGALIPEGNPGDGGDVDPTAPQLPVQPIVSQPIPTGQQPQPTTVNKPRPAAGGTYTVKAGDNLTTIAQRALGDANRWHEIVELNQGRYPGMGNNPDLIQPGWKLRMPAGASGGNDPIQPQPAPRPHPHKPHHPKPRPQPPAVDINPIQPQPQPVQPVIPAGPSNQASLDAVSWLQSNIGTNGRLSREDVQRYMPAGPAKREVLNNFNTLLFGYIDKGGDSWTHLHAGDIDRLAQAVNGGQTINQYAQGVRDRLRSQLGVEDVDTYIQQLQANGQVPSQPIPPQPQPRPVPPNVQPQPAPQPGPPVGTDEWMRRELEQTLDSQNDGGAAAVSVVRNHPEWVVVATPTQKARLIALALDNGSSKDQKQVALQVMQMAQQRNELNPTLQALDQLHPGDTQKLMKLAQGGDDSGQQIAGILLATGLGIFAGLAGANQRRDYRRGPWTQRPQYPMPFPQPYQPVYRPQPQPYQPVFGQQPYIQPGIYQRRF